MFAVVLVAALVPSAASPGDAPNGRLAFSSDRPMLGQPHENSGNAEIYSLDVVTGRRHNLSRDVRNHDSAATPSPDGRWIAYVRGTAVGAGEPWVMRADGSGKHRIVSGEAWSLAWSPDGAELAIADYRGGISVVRRDGTPVRRSVTDRFAREVAWSPDGSHLAAALNEQDGTFSVDRLAVMRPDGSELRTLGPGHGFDTLATWSPDGRELAFVHSDAGVGVNNVFAATLDGAVRRLTSYEEPAFRAITSLSWAPGGRIVYVMGGRAYAVASAGSSPRLVLRNVVRARWSRDGRLLAAARVEGALQIGITGRAARTVFRRAGDAPGDVVDGPAWAGPRRVIYTAIYFGQNDRELYAIDGDGRHLRQLTRNTVDDIEPAWSPDGRRIAFARGRLRYRVPRVASIWTMRPDGTGARRVTRGRLDTDPSWAPNNKRIAFERNGHVALVSADGGRVRVVATGRQPAWSPNGRLLAVADADELGVSVIAPDASGLRTLFRTERHDETGTPIVSSPAWRPDGTGVTFDLLLDHGRWAEEWAVTASLDGSVSSQLQCTGDHPAWSPDGAWLACDGISVGRGDAQDRRTLTDGFEPAWRP